MTRAGQVFGVLVAWAATGVCPAVQPWYVGDNFANTAINTAVWYGPNGSVSGGASGLVSSTSGAVIAKAIPSGPNQGGAGPYEYEIKTTYQFVASGGNYVTYFRATNNAHLNPAGASTGSFYAFEVKNVVVGTGTCTADLNVWKAVNGTVTPLAGGSMACFDQMIIRIVVRNNFIYIFKDKWDACCFFVNDTELTTGQPGVGVASTPAGNGIRQVIVNYADTVIPTAVPRPSIGITAYDTSVDFQWPGVGDDANGSGFWQYRFWRRNPPGTGGYALVGTTRTPSFVDLTVQPSTTYEYLLENVDFHYNINIVIFQVTTAPAGSTDPRRIGIRPEGSYWGGAVKTP